jgi:hypothetical protein
MKHVVRLLIALLIGLVAAVLNWYWMTQERAYPSYVYISDAIAAGQPISKDKLKSVQVKGDAAVLGKILVPWSQKELWYDRFAAQDYSANQPLFQRDMADTSTAGTWDTLGPFTLVGVGNEPTAAFNGEQGELIPVSGNILTLVVDESQEQEKSLLYRYLAAMRGEYYFNETAAERNLLRIIGVEPKVSARNAADNVANVQAEIGNGFEAPLLPPAPTDQQPDFAGKRLIFVSLEHIPNAPTWLRIGEEIYFMVPPGKQSLLDQVLRPSPQRIPAVTPEQ